MSDPGYALQKAIYERLTADAALAGLVGERIFDALPTATAPDMPYVNFSSYQAVDAGTDCTDEREVYLDLDVWGLRRPIVLQVLDAVHRLLHLATLDLSPSHALGEIAHRDTRVFRDADGLTTHGVITFRALTETL